MEATAAAAGEKLHVMADGLADTLALDFSRSEASASGCRALRRLLPGLEYLR